MASNDTVSQSRRGGGIEDENRAKVSPWVPISLLALSTAALAVPIVLLRRHQKTFLSNTLKDIPLPPSKASAVPPPLRRRAVLSSPTVAATPSSSLSARASSGGTTQLTQPTNPATASTPIDNFNGALYCMKAFGYATAVVFAGALTTVWGVKTYLGVQDTQEFAERMRLAVLRYMPQLSSRIHRPTDEEDGVSHRTSKSKSDAEAANWTWLDAEKRLKEAFDKEGLSGWAEAAVKELELEGRAERLRREHQ